MALSKGESGSELLARLCQKPSLALLEPQLFPSGVEPRAVIELYGEEESGKTQYLIHLIANAILPPSLNGAIIGGLGVSVVLIDNDSNFTLLRLISILWMRISSAGVSSVDARKHSENFMKNLTSTVPDLACSSADDDDHPAPKRRRIEETSESCDALILPQSSASPFQNTAEKRQSPQTNRRELVNEVDIECCVKECLKRLYIVHCNSSAQLLITLNTLETVLANRSEICLLAIDSISAFFWDDKSNGIEIHLSLIAKIIQRLAEMYSLVVFATKSAIYPRSNKKEGADHDGYKDEHREYLCMAWQELVSSRIVFSRDLPGDIDLRISKAFCASVGGKDCKHFTIDGSGVRFLSSLGIQQNFV